MATTASGTASQNGSAKLFSSPQPRSALSAAMPTAAVGKATRTINVLSSTRPRLAPQRWRRESVKSRCGEARSHSATTANTPKKNPTRISGSWAITQVSKAMCTLCVER